MSRRGNCHDNAVAESFFQLLKRERIKKNIYGTREEARSDILDYIEIFYNSKRRHGSSDQMSPTEYENQYYQRLASVWIIRGDSETIICISIPELIQINQLRISHFYLSNSIIIHINQATQHYLTKGMSSLFTCCKNLAIIIPILDPSILAFLKADNILILFLTSIHHFV
jgi:putative transposase